MAAAAAKNAARGSRFAASRLVVFAVLLAFALQSYVVQTHLHVSAPPGVAKIAAMQTSGHRKAPLNNSQTDCPFCQATNLAGTFVTPAAALLLLPLAWMQTVQIGPLMREASGPRAQGWRSRAPPRR